MTEKNKGIRIWENKRRKNTKKRNTVKPEQENLCRFIDIKFQVIERINGKFKRTGASVASGLQIRNRLYMNDGHYKLINNKGTKIVRVYEDIPEWANENLISQYEEFLNSHNTNSDMIHF